MGCCFFLSRMGRCQGYGDPPCGGPAGCCSKSADMSRLVQTVGTRLPSVNISLRVLLSHRAHENVWDILPRRARQKTAGFLRITQSHSQSHITTITESHLVSYCTARTFSEKSAGLAIFCFIALVALCSGHVVARAMIYQ